MRKFTPRARRAARGRIPGWPLGPTGPSARELELVRPAVDDDQLVAAERVAARLEDADLFAEIRDAERRGESNSGLGTTETIIRPPGQQKARSVDAGQPRTD